MSQSSPYSPTSRSSSGIAAKSESQPRRKSPPIGLMLFWAVWVGLFSLLRVIDLTGDHGLTNIISMFLIVLIGLVSMSWFVIWSGYSVRLRLFAVVLVFGVLAVFATLFRYDHVSAEMIPVFRYRFRLKPDESLARTENITERIEQRVDLGQTTSQDFPQFLGPDRTGYLPGPKLARNWAQNPPRLVWRQPIGAGWSGFSAANGFAVTMEQRGQEELVTCYEIQSGKLVWSHSEKNRHETPLGGIGPRSTPAIYSGRVYTLGPTGIVLCLNGSDGSVAWRVDIREKYSIDPDKEMNEVQWGRSASLLIADNQVIVPIGGAQGKYVSLAAFHADTGAHLWDAGNQQVSYSSPDVMTLCGRRQIVILNESLVSGHDISTGEVLWQHDWPGESHSAANASQIRRVADNLIFMSKGYFQGCSLVELTSDANGRITTKIRWHEKGNLKTKLANVVIHNGFAYGLSDGILECVELESGKRAWKSGRYGHGQILGVGDLMIVQAESGHVALVELSPRAYQELGKIEAISKETGTDVVGTTWNNVCLYGNRLLVRNAELAACFQLPLDESSQ